MDTSFHRSTPNMLDHGPSDPLDLGDYTMSESRASRTETLIQPSDPSGVALGTSPMPISPGYSSNFPSTSQEYQAFSTTFDRTQIPSPSLHQQSFGHFQPGSTSNLAEGYNLLSDASQHRLSSGSATGFHTGHNLGYMDGLGNNTSPDGSLGYNALGIGAASIEDGSTASIAEGDGDPGEQSENTPKREKNGKEKPPPAWSEMKTKAGKERKRLPLACIACRRKKIRCSGEKPACKHCLRSRIPCVYKITTRKAAPRTDYMAMLDKRLKRMEDRVIKLIPKEGPGGASAVTRAVVKPTLPGATPKTPSSKKRPADEAFGVDLDEWSKSKARDPREGMSLPPKGKDAEENRLLTEGAESLPSKELQEHLAEVYFDYVYGQSYPLLHKPSFMRKLSAGLVPPVLVLAVCAISARFSTHPQVRTEPAFLRGEKWASTAREIALKRYDSPNITILIVYLLLGLHEFGTCQGGRSWMFGGMAQRMAYAMQLHRDLDHDPLGKGKEGRAQLSPTDREIRRRTMWSCFLMDRFNSSGTERPLFVQEQFITVQLPIKEQYFQMEVSGPTEDLDGGVPNPVPGDTDHMSNAKDNMGVMAYLIRLVAIWGRVIKFMNLGGKERETHPMWSPQSTFHELKTAALEWNSSLPTFLHYNAKNLEDHTIEKTANQFLYIHILYHQIILFMNRFALPSIAGSRPPKDMPRDFLTEAARAALNAANQISILINEAMDYHVVAPFAGYCAFFSSTVHVHGVFSKNPKLEASSKKYLAYNVKYVSKMRKYWGMYHFVAENLKDLYRQHADAALRGSSATNTKGGPANIFQYGDWFDRYPHGVSSTDYEDPAADEKREPGTDAVLGGQKSDLQSVEEFFASLSPPSKAEHQRKLAKKAKHKKSASQLASQSTSSPSVAQQAPQDVQTQQRTQSIDHITISHDLTNAQSPFDGAFLSPSGTQPWLDPYFIRPHGGLFGDLDRQMVLSSYDIDLPLSTDPPAVNPTASIPSLPPDPLDNNPSGIWDMDMASLNFADPSTAWFMPFNMEPPDIGADAGVLGGGVWGYDFEAGAQAPLEGMELGTLEAQEVEGNEEEGSGMLEQMV
ncbi:hypothetical protein H2201_008220 [Coniosporium apollinis]|uniref:Zn(2)-C6 fungal-type domain-containing protein n=1 Tax=Coniosporium apollinis TaxID=61459 RepID=A0ABQ9NNE1_9PEZI|nr:hypothetical protein H2201_008220 [Coniosporium apollinis]